TAPRAGRPHPASDHHQPTVRLKLLHRGVAEVEEDGSYPVTVAEVRNRWRACWSQSAAWGVVAEVVAVAEAVPRAGDASDRPRVRAAVRGVLHSVELPACLCVRDVGPGPLSAVGDRCPLALGGQPGCSVFGIDRTPNGWDHRSGAG